MYIRVHVQQEAYQRVCSAPERQSHEADATPLNTLHIWHILRLKQLQLE